MFIILKTIYFYFKIVDFKREASILNVKIATEFGLQNVINMKKPYFILDSLMDMDFIIDFMMYKGNLVYNQNEHKPQLFLTLSISRICQHHICSRLWTNMFFPTTSEILRPRGIKEDIISCFFPLNSTCVVECLWLITKS